MISKTAPTSTGAGSLMGTIQFAELVAASSIALKIQPPVSSPSLFLFPWDEPFHLIQNLQAEELNLSIGSITPQSLSISRPGDHVSSQKLPVIDLRKVDSLPNFHALSEPSVLDYSLRTPRSGTESFASGKGPIWPPLNLTSPPKPKLISATFPPSFSKTQSNPSSKPIVKNPPPVHPPELQLQNFSSYHSPKIQNPSFPIQKPPKIENFSLPQTTSLPAFNPPTEQKYLPPSNYSFTDVPIISPIKKPLSNRNLDIPTVDLSGPSSPSDNLDLEETIQSASLLNKSKRENFFLSHRSGKRSSGDLQARSTKQSSGSGEGATQSFQKTGKISFDLNKCFNLPSDRL